MLITVAMFMPADSWASTQDRQINSMRIAEAFTESADPREMKSIDGVLLDTDNDGIFEAGLCEGVWDRPETELATGDPVKIKTYCRRHGSQVMFNMREVVAYLWNVDNRGIQYIQVKFHPNPTAGYEVQLEMSIPFP